MNIVRCFRSIAKTQRREGEDVRKFALVHDGEELFFLKQTPDPSFQRYSWCSPQAKRVGVEWWNRIEELADIDNFDAIPGLTPVTPNPSLIAALANLH